MCKNLFFWKATPYTNTIWCSNFFGTHTALSYRSKSFGQLPESLKLEILKVVKFHCNYPVAISSSMKGNPAKYCTKVMLNVSANASNMHCIQLLTTS